MSYAFDYREMLQKLCYNLYEPCNGTISPHVMDGSKESAEALHSGSR